MLLIPDNTTLRSFIPNSFSSLPNEPTLFDKLVPFIRSAETWFLRNIIPENVIVSVIDRALSQDDPLYFLPRRIVALKAWLLAIPSVDVVIGNNGIGVVETNSLKPASKAKIDRLLSSVADELDIVLEALLPMLPEIPGWLDSPQADTFRKTLFPTFRILRQRGVSNDLWNNWVAISPKIHDIENEIGESWISVPVLERLRRANLDPDLRRDPLLSLLISKVKAAVRIMLDNPQAATCPPLRQLEEANAIVRGNTDRFPEWCMSPTARFFKTPAFRNSPDSSAYFF